MVKIVLVAILVYSMSCLKILEGIVEQLNQIMRKFFWNGPEETNRVPLLAWDKICKQ